MQDFVLYSCCKERSVTNWQNDDNVQLFQYSMFRRQKNDRQKIRRVRSLSNPELLKAFIFKGFRLLATGENQEYESMVRIFYRLLWVK